MATILVTGANRGIGLELCRQWAARGERVIAVCRNTSPALQQLDVRVVDDVDVARRKGVSRLRDALGDTRLDVLLNNAGILLGDGDRDGELDWDALRRQFEVNALGPLRVTRALAGHLGPGGKVGLVTSRVGSIGDNGSGGNYGYRMSKAAANMAGVNLAHELRDREIAVVLLHPGYVATEMTGGQGGGVEAAASGLIARIDALDMGSTGTFWHARGEPLPW